MGLTPADWTQVWKCETLADFLKEGLPKSLGHDWPIPKRRISDRDEGSSPMVCRSESDWISKGSFSKGRIMAEDENHALQGNQSLKEENVDTSKAIAPGTGNQVARQHPG